MKYVIAILWPISMLCLLYLGVTEFDHATTWIPLFRGLFWIIIGSISFWYSLNELYDL